MNFQYKFLIMVLIGLSLPGLSVATEKCVLLNVQFNSLPHKHFNKHTLNFTKSIRINPYHVKSKIVQSESSLHGKFPETTALMVKPVHFHDDEIKLQFNLVHYGFSRAGSILTQPVFIIKKGQPAEIRTDQYKLSVTADWA